MKNIAIIGGSGAAGVVSGLGIKEEELTTCFNVETQALDYMKFQHGDINVVFALRHGKEHTKDPARIKPKYLAKQLSKLVNPEETLVVQTSASGSLDVDIDLVDEGGIVVCDSVMRGF